MCQRDTMMDMRRPMPRLAAWPKVVNCLWCGKPHKAQHAGDRFHPECRDMKDRRAAAGMEPVESPSSVSGRSGQGRRYAE